MHSTAIFKGCFVTKNSNTTQEGRKRVWIYTTQT